MHATFPSLLLAGLVASSAVSAAEVLGGEGHLSFRSRVELVDDDRFDERAEASTLRARLNWRSAEWAAWSAFVEVDYVGELGLDHFNSGEGTSGGDRARYPVVADPNGLDLNQAYVQRHFGDAGTFRAGRQRILLDDQRFVGGVGWRQNEQTYDSVSLAYPANEQFNLFYAYLDGVNRIFGDDVAAGDHDHASHLLEARWKLGPGQLSAYGFLLDNETVAALSTRTVGLAWTGKASLGDVGLSYRAQYARQSDYADNPRDYDADYWRLTAKLAFDPIAIGAGYEQLGGGDIDGAAFTTSLATLHAFNGWADQFLGTPDAGLADRFVDASGKVGRVSWKLVWHDFETEEGSEALGTELDALIGTSFGTNNRYGLQLKLADFDGDGGRPDVTKTWLTFTAAF